MDTAPVPISQIDQPVVVKKSISPKWVALTILVLLFTILLILSPGCNKLNSVNNQSPINNDEAGVNIDNDDSNTTNKLTNDNTNNQSDQLINNPGNDSGSNDETITPSVSSCQANGYTASPIQGIIQLDQASFFKFLTAKSADGNQALRDIQELTCLEKLMILNDGKNNITDLTPLAQLTQLKVLDIDGTSVTDISPLNNLRNLQHLMLANSPIANVDGINNLTRLTLLNLFGDTHLTNISAIRNFINLIDLGLSGTNLTDLSPIQSLSKLKTLTLFNTNWSRQVLVDGINPLIDPDWRSKLIYPPEIQALFTTNPNLEINWTPFQIK